MPTVGGVPRRLGNLPISSQDAAWSPDGSAIVYVKDNGDLYVVNSDGTASRKLLSPPGAPYLPRWSPDGNSINFSLANFKSNTLWEVSADGTNPHPILPAWDFSGAAC
ncbi:MAG: hypothetical protein DMG21_01785, partial [Acidobacteria bacterium]